MSSMIKTLKVYSRRLSVALNVLFLFFAGVACAGDIRPFTKGSYQEILNENKDQPFLLVLWSIDCPPCHQEMAMLGGFLKQHPELNLVLVGTDQAEDPAALTATLDRHQLKAAQNWVFSQDIPERLRYEIDPRWYGELPRSYFFNAAHGRIGKSGRLTEEAMAAWWSQASEKPTK